ncbi:MAG TPA: hypothetical protein VFJ70_05130 [Burkholderiales bacterium]|nr:hypothetical protein [Burkholderiales bacterium]
MFTPDQIPARLRDFAELIGVEEQVLALEYEAQLERLQRGARLERYIVVRAEKHARESLARMKRQP